MMSIAPIWQTLFSQWRDSFLGTNSEASSPNGAGYLVHAVRTKCVLCGVAEFDG